MYFEKIFLRIKHKCAIMLTDTGKQDEQKTFGS